MGLLEYLIVLSVGALIMLLGYAAGRLAKFLLSEIFRRLGLNDWFRNFNIGRAMLKSGFTAGDFFASLAAWVIYIAAFLAAGSYVSNNFGYAYVAALFDEVLAVYVYGFVKFFVAAIVGFIMVDGFVEYVYKGAVSKEAELVGPIADYLRIVLYLVVVTFALQQGGIDVSILSSMLMPIAWGLVAAMVAVVIARLLKR